MNKKALKPILLLTIVIIVFSIIYVLLTQQLNHIETTNTKNGNEEASSYSIPPFEREEEKEYSKDFSNLIEDEDIDAGFMPFVIEENYENMYILFATDKYVKDSVMTLYSPDGEILYQSSSSDNVLLNKIPVGKITEENYGQYVLKVTHYRMYNSVSTDIEDYGENSVNKDSSNSNELWVLAKEVVYSPDNNPRYSTEYVYDPHGNMLSCIQYDENHIMTNRYEYEYNEKNEKIKETYYDNSENAQDSLAYEYNADGTLCRILKYNLDGELKHFTKYTYEYDTKGKLVALYEYSGDDTLFRYTEYSYDENGNKSEKYEKQLENVDSYYEMYIQYFYDSSGKEYIVNYCDTNKNVIYQYVSERNHIGNETKYSTYNSQHELEHYYTYEYDENQNMIKSIWYDKNQEILSWTEYDYQLIVL